MTKKALLSIILIMIFSLPQAFADQFFKSVHMAGFSYPPFYMGKNENIQGIAPQIIAELFGRLAMKTHIKIYPLKRALRYLKYGGQDAIMILIKTEDREKYIDYTVPIMSVRGLIWYAADHPVVFEKLEQLSHYRIGVTQGYSYGSVLDALLKKFRYVEISNSDVSNYRKLMSHRLDIFPGNEIVARSLFKQYPEFKNKFLSSPQAFTTWVLYMGISKKSWLTQYISEINTVINQLKREGYIDRLVKKYSTN